MDGDGRRGEERKGERRGERSVNWIQFGLEDLVDGLGGWKCWCNERGRKRRACAMRFGVSPFFAIGDLGLV